MSTATDTTQAPGRTPRGRMTTAKLVGGDFDGETVTVERFQPQICKRDERGTRYFYEIEFDGDGCTPTGRYVYFGCYYA